jgi:hypothetical protein
MAKALLALAACLPLAMLGLWLTYKAPEPRPGIDPSLFPKINLASARRIQRGMTLEQVMAIVQAAPGMHEIHPLKGYGTWSHYSLVLPKTREEADAFDNRDGYFWSSEERQLFVGIDKQKGVILCSFVEVPPKPLSWRQRIRNWLRF